MAAVSATNRLELFKASTVTVDSCCVVKLFKLFFTLFEFMVDVDASLHSFLL